MDDIKDDDHNDDDDEHDDGDRARKPRFCMA